MEVKFCHSSILNTLGEIGWIDGAAILVAVILVSHISAFTDYDKEKKFRALNAVKNDRRVKVKRNGKEDVITILDVQVGEVVIIDTGDLIPADGLLIEGQSISICKVLINIY